MATTRVYILARELGVPSSAIVKRCQDEGIDVPNHMATISAGLAAEIRQWFSEGENATGPASTKNMGYNEVQIRQGPQREDPLSDGSPGPRLPDPIANESESTVISEATFSLGPLTIPLQPTLSWFAKRRRGVLLGIVAMLFVALVTWRWWIPLFRRSSQGDTTNASIQARTEGQMSPGIITTGPNSPVTIDYGSSEDPEESSPPDKLLRSLKDVCEDIDSRPLLQREETAKHYEGLRVKRELLSLLEIIDEDKGYTLLMIFPGEFYVPFSGGWGISCEVKRDAYPELVGAKHGLQLHVTGVIQAITGRDITLANTSIEFE